MAFLSGEEMRMKMRMQLVRNYVRSLPDKQSALSAARKLAQRLDTIGPQELDFILKKVEADTVADEQSQASKDLLAAIDSRLKSHFDKVDARFDTVDTSLKNLTDALQLLTNHVTKSPRSAA